MENRVIIILGPTCSGKSQMAFEIAKTLNSEIISADSRQFYRGLDIGTAKPPGTMLAQVRHHFINSLNPEDDYNISRFETQALQIIHDLWKQRKIPIVAGGSGLYIRAITNGVFSVASDEAVREELKSILDADGKHALHRRLSELDPVTAAAIPPKNWKRVLRALEVKIITGKSITELHGEYADRAGYDFIQVGLNWERGELYRRINERVNLMIANGLVEETMHLKQSGFSPSNNSLNTVGYKEIFEYLDGKQDLPEAIRQIQRNTRHYAKRQLTWFRKSESIVWKNITTEESIFEIAAGLSGILRNENDPVSIRARIAGL